MFECLPAMRPAGFSPVPLQLVSVAPCNHAFAQPSFGNALRASVLPERLFRVGFRLAAPYEVTPDWGKTCLPVVVGRLSISVRFEEAPRPAVADEDIVAMRSYIALLSGFMETFRDAHLLTTLLAGMRGWAVDRLGALQDAAAIHDIVVSANAPSPARRQPAVSSATVPQGQNRKKKLSEKVVAAYREALEGETIVPPSLRETFLAREQLIVKKIVTKIRLIRRMGHRTTVAAVTESLLKQEVHEEKKLSYAAYLGYWRSGFFKPSTAAPLSLSRFVAGTRGAPSAYERMRCVEERGLRTGAKVRVSGVEGGPFTIKAVSARFKVSLAERRETLEPFECFPWPS